MTADLNQSTETPWFEPVGYLSLRRLENGVRNGRNSSLLSATGLLKSRLNADHDSFTTQIRPLLFHATNSGVVETSGYLDELYWEHRFSASSFIFLGRRKISNGVAIGRNPSDFFNQRKTQDRILNDEDRRAEIEGDDMIGWSYFGRSYSIQSLLAAPSENSRKRIRAMLQVNTNLNSLSTDLSLIAYYADLPSFGLNLSTLSGENTTVYAEAALRRGRDRQRPVLSASDVVTDSVDHANQWIADAVIGGQYTTDNGVTFTAEYWRNNNGFSDKEYAGIFKTLTTSQGNPYLACKFLSIPHLRRNSSFFRVGDIPLFNTIKGEFTWIHNLDDSSNFLRSAVNFDVSKFDSFRIGADGFSGSKFSEFGSSKINRRAFIIYKRNF